MKRTILFLALLLSSLGVFAQDFYSITTSNHTLSYVITSDENLTCSVAGYVEAISGDLDIPPQVYRLDSEGNILNTYSVTSIGGSAFEGCSGLTSVTIPNSVTTIGERAFYDCYLLTSVTIPNSVTAIGYSAFSFCSGLTSVTIGNSVTTIGESAFYYCSGLTSVTIPNSVTSIGGSAFEYCSGLTSVTIPNSVTSIGDRAFYNCSGLTSVTIPNSVTSIGDDAFYGCSGLTSVTIPNSVTTIGINAFYNCSGLTSVTIPNSVTRIEASAFSGCSGLTSINIPSSVTSIGVSAFVNCSSLTSVTIPNSVTSIAMGVFSGCSSLTSVTIPNSVTTIGMSAFYNCSGLTSVTIPNSVTSIGGHAFNNCSSLTSVTIPNSVTSIGDYVFYNCSGLTSVTIPNSVTSIGGNAFEYCYDLTSVTIPNSVTSIGNYAFYGCSGLTSVTIPNSVTSIGDYAFGYVRLVSYCGSATGSPWGATRVGCFYEDGEFIFEDATKTTILAYIGTGASVSIPNSVTSIGSNAFYNCSSLTSVTIGRSVTSIGNYAFSGCQNLTSLDVYADQVPTLGTDVFRGVSTTIPVTIWPYSASRVTEYQTAGWPFTNYICPGYYLFYALDDESGTATVYGSQDYQDPNRVAIAHVGLLDDLHIPSSVEYNERTYSVTSIGDFAFYAVDNLSSVTIPNSVTSIGGSAFASCIGLTSVTIPNSVTSIGRTAFWGCSGLRSVTIGNSVTSIGDGAFFNCSGLTSVTIPNSVTSIGYSAFWGCSGLTSVTIGESVTSIGDWAFYNCSNIESLVIGSSVNSIVVNSFAETSSLKTVYNLSGTEIGINYFGLDANRIVTGIVAMGSGKNVLYKIPESYSIVMTETDQVDNNIPESSLPTNFIAKKNGNWFAKDIVLTDGVDAFNAPVDFTAENVTYTRSYEQGNRSTICLPFKPTMVNGQPTTNLKFYAFTGFDGSTITFDEVLFANLQANTPYMVEWPESKVAQNFVFGATTNAFIPATGDANSRTVTNGNGKFIGTMERMHMNSTNYYGYKNGYFVQSRGDQAEDAHAHVNPFRAYFQITPSGSQGFAMPTELSVRFNTAEDNVGIDSVEPQQSNIRYSNDVYDMMGRMVRKNAESLEGLRKGVYIWKGEKKIVF